MRIECDDLEAPIYVDHGVSSAPGATVWAAIRPEKIHISREKPAGRRQLGRGRGAGHRLHGRHVHLPGEARHRQGRARHAAERATATPTTASPGTSACTCTGTPTSPVVVTEVKRCADSALGLAGRTARWSSSVPYLWLLLFFLVPFVIVLKISFSTAQIAMPPYAPLLHWVSEKVGAGPAQLRQLHVPGRGHPLLEGLPQLDQDRVRLDAAVPADRLPDRLRHRAQQPVDAQHPAAAGRSCRSGPRSCCASTRGSASSRTTA